MDRARNAGSGPGKEFLARARYLSSQLPLHERTQLRALPTEPAKRRCLYRLRAKQANPVGEEGPMRCIRQLLTGIAIIASASGYGLSEVHQSSDYPRGFLSIRTCSLGRVHHGLEPSALGAAMPKASNFTKERKLDTVLDRLAERLPHTEVCRSSQFGSTYAHSLAGPASGSAGLRGQVRAELPKRPSGTNDVISSSSSGLASRPCSPQNAQRHLCAPEGPDIDLDSLALLALGSLETAPGESFRGSCLGC